MHIGTYNVYEAHDLDARHLTQVFTGHPFSFVAKFRCRISVGIFVSILLFNIERRIVYTASSVLDKEFTEICAKTRTFFFHESRNM